MSLLEVRLRPTGPWRVGDRAGDRERVDVVYHSDALYSAVTHAMRALGWLEEWLEATARASGAPAVRFSSLFPFVGKTRLVAPPKSAWPPAHGGRLYLQGAKLIPLEVVKSGVVEESRWQVDGESGCLIPLGGSAPFRVSMRAGAAVDRLTGTAEPHRTACLEFASNAGWWGVFEVADAVWEARVKAALRLLADSGFGGERSRGWGRASEPHFSDASQLLAGRNGGGKATMLWLLSLYSPHESDVVDWGRSEYTATVRGGWTDSVAGTGAKKLARMVVEGSVLASAALRGTAVDVAPEDFAHPVYRSGFALAMPVPAEIVVRTAETSRGPRTPATREAEGGAPAVASGEAQAEPQGLESGVEAETEPSVVPGAETVVGDEAAEPETGEPTESTAIPGAETAAGDAGVTELPAAEPETGEPTEPTATPGAETAAGDAAAEPATGEHTEPTAVPGAETAAGDAAAEPESGEHMEPSSGSGAEPARDAGETVAESELPETTPTHRKPDEVTE